MAQDTSGSATGGTALVIRGEMAARIDRLPASWLQWELALIVQAAFACILATDGVARTLYPFVWEPQHLVTSSQYSVIYAVQTGIAMLIGGYSMGWLADKIGRRRALMLSAVLAAAFIWSFGYVTNYPALLVLSIPLGFGCGGALAINVAYISEITAPTVRGRVVMGAQVLAILLVDTVLVGLIPHYMIPGQYRGYLWLLAGVNLLMLLLLAWRLPESPRWLETREHFDQARKIVERMEARVMKRHPVLPEPDLTPHRVVAEERTSVFAVFSRQYLLRTVFLLVVFVLGYGGIIYGNASYAFVFLAETRGYGPGFIFAVTAWGGVAAAGLYALNALFGDRTERRTGVLAGAVLFAGSWYGLYNVHSTPAVVTFYIGSFAGGVVFLFNLYSYTPNNFATRMRTLGTGWTDGMGHMGAWGGVLLAGVVFSPAAPLGWILLITIPGALAPGLMIGIFGARQRRKVLEELAK